MSFQPRTLEYIPSGFFEVRFSVEFPNAIYEKWATSVLALWHPKNLEKTDESQTSAVIVYTNQEPGGGGWLGDYCTLRVIPGSSSKKAQLSATWTPGNKGTYEVFPLFDRVLDLASQQVVGDFYIGDEGYGLEHKGKINSDQLRALLGTAKPNWKVSDVQANALEFFTIELTDKGVVFKGQDESSSR